MFYNLKNHTRKSFQKDQIILHFMSQLEICVCVFVFSWKTIRVEKLFEEIQLCICVFLENYTVREIEEIQSDICVCVCLFSL